MQFSRIKIFAVVVFLLSLFVAPKVLAATAPASSLGTAGASAGTGTWYNYGPSDFAQYLKAQAAGNIGIESWAGGSIVMAVTNGITCAIANCGSSAQTAGTGTTGAPKTDLERPSGVGTMASLIGVVYDGKPASSVDYVINIAHNAGFNPVKPAYAAAGIGFTALDPVLKLWQVVRNITYLAFAIIFVVVGLMIIMRVKIDPKTVVSIQNALPKIFFSLILITFSYPIAGFMIDLMYVVIGLILSIGKTSGLITNYAQFSQNLQDSSVFQFVGGSEWWGAWTGSGRAIQLIVAQLAGPLDLGGLTSNFIGAVGGLIIAIAILYALVKTWFMLLGAYVNILIGVILSPLAMLGEAIPGMSTFGTWMRSMLSNLAMFPLVVVFVVFGKAIIDYGHKFAGATSGTAFVPPLIGGNNPAAITSLIGLGLLLMIPAAGQMLQEWFKSPMLKYGTAWQEPLQGGVGVGQRGLGYATEPLGAAKAAYQKEWGAYLIGSPGAAKPSPKTTVGRIARWWPF